MDKKIIVLAVFFLFLIAFSTSADAQCAMCSLAAEQNMKDGGTYGKGLNKGILMLLTLPYLLIGFFGYQIYKSKTASKQSES